MRIFKNLFTDHPHAIGETYYRHFCHAISFALILIGAGFACAVHAFIPKFFDKTASTAVSRLYSRMILERGNKDRN